MMVAVSNLR